ncbi:MAG: PorT family protein [Flavobacterium sp.]|nr:PorT family protein [Flavobacterium sp.]
MKRITLSIVLLLSLSFANAQDDKGVRFGLKAGLNLANIGGDMEHSSMKAGFHIGGLAEIMLTENFALQPELVFSMQGTKYEYSSPVLDVDENIDLAYLNIPLMAKYYVTDAFNIHAGPQIGFLMSAKFGGEDVKERYKSFDFGFGIGTGYNFRENFGIEARYNAGMVNIAAEQDGGGDYKESNSVIQLSFLYKF